MLRRGSHKKVKKNWVMKSWVKCAKWVGIGNWGILSNEWWVMKKKKKKTKQPLTCSCSQCHLCLCVFGSNPYHHHLFTFFFFFFRHSPKPYASFAISMWRFCFFLTCFFLFNVFVGLATHVTISQNFKFQVFYFILIKTNIWFCLYSFCVGNPAN